VADAVLDPTKLSPEARLAMMAEAYSDVWAQVMALGVDGRNWDLKGRAYLKDVYRDNGQRIVCKKSAQMGFTVAFLVQTLHRVLIWKWNGLYLLPTKVGVIPFVQGRINPIIDSNPAIDARFSSVDSITHKRTDSNNLYFRGSTVATDLREIPVDFEIWDERDKMASNNLHLALTRMDGSPHKHLATLSTPTAEDYGVDAEYKDSDQRQWTLRCLFCNHAQFLDWEENVVIGDTVTIDECKATTYVQCQHCHKPWTHAQIMEMAEEGFWDPQQPGRAIHGYYINQLVSPTRTIDELTEIWYKGEIRGDIDASRELWNSALGLAWAAPGDRLTVENLNDAMDGYEMPRLHGISRGAPVAIGVDIGRDLHVVAMQGFAEEKRRVVDIRIEHWQSLTELFLELTERGINWQAVMDANPEKALAENLAARFPQLWLAFYRDPKLMSQVAEWKPAEPLRGKGHNVVMIDRTMAVDMCHSMIRRRQIVLPKGANQMVNPGKEHGDFYSQMIAQTAITEPDSMGNPRRVYVQPGGRPDHFDHAATYCTIATTLQPGYNNPVPEYLSMNDNPETFNILEETSGLFTQDDDGFDFDNVRFDF
jgi:hypothetical protein